MSSRPLPTAVVTLVLCGVALVFFVLWDAFRGRLPGLGGQDGSSDRMVDGEPIYPIVPQDSPDGGNPGGAAADAGVEGDPLDALMAEFVRAFLAAPDAIPRQAVLRFASEDEYRRFLAAARGRGLEILGTIDGLRAVQLGFTDGAALRAALDGFGDDLGGLEANYMVTIPGVPAAPEERAQGADPVGFGGGLLGALGISGDNSGFGDGVTVAVLDSGISQHPAFANASLRRLDLAGGTGADEVGHGTAVSSLIAGEIPETPGVSPAADLLSYRVTNAEGTSDSFLLAEGILAAVDAGADIINISLGSQSDSPIVADAVTYAAKNGTIVVAASGNETGSEASFPARYSGVVSVGGNDASGFQLPFSNSSPSLDFSAPGYELNAAFPGERIIAFTGTSASAPVVSGAIAAVMSERQVSAVEALDLLRLTADEAGAPGADPAYGNGVLNVGRALQTGRSTVSDVAAVAPYYDPLSNQILFSVENRGTSPLVNVPLRVTVAGSTTATHFATLLPNEEKVYAFPLTGNAFATGEPITASSEVTAGSASDANPANNAARGQISPP